VEFSRRKWGWYLTLYSAKRFKIKFLYFKAGKSCSLQRHFKRHELWCSVFGSGWLSVDKKKIPLKSGDYKAVPVNKWHRYRASKNSLILEIQTGHCVETDIQRAA